MLKIRLVDTNAQLVDWWRRAFADQEHVTVVEGDFFAEPADAMVSPANSFGFMDGGLDYAIRVELGHAVERRLQQAILEEDGGELLIGQAKIISTSHAKWPYLIAAPTMRVPEDIRGTVNAYLAFRAILREVERHNANTRANARITSIVCPGLGTGIGKLDASMCATQMLYAYTLWLRKEVTLPPPGEIRLVHMAMTVGTLNRQS